MLRFPFSFSICRDGKVLIRWKMWCAFSPWQRYNLQGCVPEPISFEGSLSLVERNHILSSSSANFLSCEATGKGGDDASPGNSCYQGGCPFRPRRSRTIEHHTQCEFVPKQGGYLLHINLLPTCASLMYIFNQLRLKVANIWNNIPVDLNLLQWKTPALNLCI